jgi:hypothetical protein
VKEETQENKGAEADHQTSSLIPRLLFSGAMPTDFAKSLERLRKKLQHLKRQEGAPGPHSSRLLRWQLNHRQHRAFPSAP